MSSHFRYSRYPVFKGAIHLSGAAKDAWPLRTDEVHREVLRGTPALMYCCGRACQVQHAGDSVKEITGRLREPFSGLSHMAGIFLGIAALVTLLILSKGDPWKVTGFAIYGASVIILYLASTLYHSIPCSPAAVERLRRFDQCAIFIMIAGSYTPVCLIKMRGPWGWSMLAVAWGIAAGGIIVQTVWSRMPCWLNVVLYILMGWTALIGIGPMSRAIGPVGLFWLVLGGVIYSCGIVVFATERPRLWPGVFGFHDLWHLFVLAGSAAHFMLMISIL
ncbi:MAG: hemolysin III family protein [Chloroflexi bacterium]|nr:hemolysin III family protein [Chloroflexota bacterium]